MDTLLHSPEGLTLWHKQAMKAYATDLREKVVAAIDRGLPRAEVASVVAVSPSTIKRWVRRRGQTGTLAPSPIPDRPSVLGRRSPPGWNGNSVRARTRRLPSTAPHGTPIPPSTSARPPCVAPSRASTGRNETARAARWDTNATVDPRQGIFIDKCGPHLAHTRVYGRAPRGERAVGGVPKNRGRVTTLTASLTASGMGPALTLAGGTSKAVFLTWVREALVPILQPGQIVILDNLEAHRPSAVRDAIEATGARLPYLPGYSPDFNPIELAFGKLKARLRRIRARTHAALDTAIADAIAAITPVDIHGYFTHCGYPLSGQPL